MLLAVMGIAQAQAPKRDTVVLSVYNNNQRFMLYPMPFGKNKPDKEFTAEMVMAYDTVNVLKDAVVRDSTGKGSKKWHVERKMGKFTTAVKDKIVLMYYHPSYDVSARLQHVFQSKKTWLVRFLEPQRTILLDSVECVSVDITN